jgi:hypothetical protein
VKALLDHCRRWSYATVASEISRVARYSDRLVHVDPLTGDSGILRNRIDSPKTLVVFSLDLDALDPQAPEHRTVVLLNGNLNVSTDIQGLLSLIRTRLRRSDRVVAIVYNSYLEWLFRIADRFKLRNGPPCTTFVTRPDLVQLARLSGFEVTRIRPAVYLPWHFLGLGTILNMLLPAIPGLRWLGLMAVVVLRPVEPETGRRPSLTIVIPARNERGNIESALRRLPDFGTRTEIIFVEGHSTDGTWEEIQRVVPLWDGRGNMRVRAFQQERAGKADAVRLGFSKASGDVLTILDADLTMPPELLPRFYEAYCRGLGDFVNGTRLVYPMEGEAMRFLNRLGNIFFAKILSWILEARVADTLCGTKLLARRDYQRCVAWRADFGEFDPFGDFELLFPAAVLALGVAEVPVAYRARTYGTTNIRRFRDGLALLRMTIVGLLRVRLGAGRQGEGTT